jgi:hypothetical protein
MTQKYESNLQEVFASLQKAAAKKIQAFIDPDRSADPLRKFTYTKRVCQKVHPHFFNKKKSELSQARTFLYPPKVVS